MKVCIFSGVIALNKNNIDVRKNYLLEKVQFFGTKSIKLEILSPSVAGIEYFKAENIVYTEFAFLQKKGFKLFSSFVCSMPALFKVDCDIVHCLNYQAFFSAHIVNFFRQKRFVILFEAMGLAFAESEISAKKSLKTRLLRPIVIYLERLAFKKSDAVIVYTEILKEFVIQHFKLDNDRIFVVPHGVALDGMCNDIVSADISSVFPEGKSIAMYAGLLSELHGTPYLMDIALFLSTNRPDICLMVLGSGPMKERFEEFIEKHGLSNVIMTGFLPSEQIPYYLKKADVLLIPHSRCLQTELDQPTKLFEYLKAGKPIVSFNFEAVAEVVKDASVLVRSDDAVSFAEGIIQVIDNKDHYLKLALEARSIVNYYSWENAAEKQYNAYKVLYENRVR